MDHTQKTYYFVLTVCHFSKEKNFHDQGVSGRVCNREIESSRLCRGLKISSILLHQDLVGPSAPGNGR